MIAAARVAAAIEVLDVILSGETAEKALTHWGRTHRFAGSGDRAAIRDLVFDGLRGWRSLAALGGSDTGRGIMIGLARRDGQDLDLIFTGIGHAPAALGPEDTILSQVTDAMRADLPDWLFPTFTADLGEDAAAVLDTMQSRAAVFLRVNVRRTTLQAVIESLASESIQAHPHPSVRTAVQVTTNARKIQTCHAYQTGLVELQDAASQEAVLRLYLRDGQRVLDLCAGGGGKSLAMASLAAIEVSAYDAEPRRMIDLAARAARAGTTIVQVSPTSLRQMRPFDLVLVDAPCSGSGTWRRTPDAKWRFNQGDLTKLVELQGTILRHAAGLVAASGTLAYATCSVLKVENQRQILNFVTANPEWTMVQEWQHLPTVMGDGFYLTQLQRPQKQPKVETSA